MSKPVHDPGEGAGVVLTYLLGYNNLVFHPFLWASHGFNTLQIQMSSRQTPEEIGDLSLQGRIEDIMHG